jgi:hypothetical protein
MECISILLKTGWRGEMSPDLAGQLLILFTFLANPSSADSGLPATSEELQAAAFKCMAELIADVARDPRGKQVLTQTANIPTLGKAVLVMVDSFVEVPSNHVKLQAVTAIQALSSNIADLDALASFLPRIISSLTKVLTISSSNRANFRVLERGLDTMAVVLLRTLSDRETRDLPSHESDVGSKEGDKVLRTKSWLQATAGQIKVALANVLKLRNHDKKEVRYALLQFCLSVIRECRASLADCIGMIIETLVTLAGRPGGTGTVESELKVLVSSDLGLATLLRESLRGWVISLPRLMQSKDDIGRRQLIHQISTTLWLLSGEQMDLGMVDDLLAANLRDSVSNIMKDSIGTGSIVETPVTTAGPLIVGNSGSTTFKPLKLRLQGQDMMMNEFQLLLLELAKSDSALKVAQELIDSLDSGTEETQLASFWLSVRLMESLLQQNSAVDEFLDFGSITVQDEILEQLYSVSIERLTRPSTDDDTNWHMQALSLEVVALQARKHRSEFRVELIDALYPVLHYLGTPNPGLRDHAMACLNTIAEACEYDSASDLIVSNVDYIINAVGLKLNYHDISPQAPQVLLMMMRLCGPSLLPYLDDLVSSMFSALERYHGYPKLVELLFSVLKGMAEEGVKAPQLMIEAGDQSASHSRSTAQQVTTVSAVVAAIRKLQDSALKQDDAHEKLLEPFPTRPWKDEDPTKDPREDTPIDEQDTAVQKTDEPPPPAPRTFSLLLKISELTQHYLTSSSPSLRTSLLSLLHTTIPALAKHENSFLPLINTLWPVLLPRLNDPEGYVVANALDIMALMCEHTGDFMKSRIEGTWEDIKALHRQTMKKARGNARAGTGKSSTNVTGLRLPYRTQNESLTSAMMVVSGSGRDQYQPEKYIDTPTRMIREALIRLLCATAKHVAVREDYFDEAVDMLDGELGREDVREALEWRNPDAVWLRLWRKGDALTVKRVGHVPVGKESWEFVAMG